MSGDTTSDNDDCDNNFIDQSVPSKCSYGMRENIYSLQVILRTLMVHTKLS